MRDDQPLHGPSQASSFIPGISLRVGQGGPREIAGLMSALVPRPPLRDHRSRSAPPPLAEAWDALR